MAVRFILDRGFKTISIVEKVIFDIYTRFDVSQCTIHETKPTGLVKKKI